MKSTHQNFTANKKVGTPQPTAKRQHVTTKEWSLGFVLVPGVSFVHNSALNNNSVAASYNSTGGSNTINSGVNTNSSNPVHPGFGYTMGAFVEKKLTRQTSLSAGINYVSFTVSNGLSDSALSYYSLMQKNHFKFLQLPILLKLEINKKAKIPLYLEGGFTLSALVNSGSFINTSFYNKMRVGFNSAVSAGLFSIQKHQVLIGPYYHYSVGKLANKGLYYNKHLSFFGVSAEIILNR